MTEREERDLAHRLAKGSDPIDFDRALELVQWKPSAAEELVRMDEQMERRQRERAIGRERRRRALIEDFF